MNLENTPRPGLGLRLTLAAICGALFFAAYGACNLRTSELAAVPTAFVAADYRIPFIPWTIVPYWSLDILFVTAFLIQKDGRELWTHTMRVVAGILAACAGFLLFPLRCDAGPLSGAGVFQPWFSTLGLFDKPFNQAPSLHIILLLIVWRAHLPKVPERFRPVAYAWGALIALSTLTTRQHGLIDVLAGAAVGVVLVNLIRPEAWLHREGVSTPRLVLRYGAGAAIALVAAFLLAPVSVVAAWVALWAACAAGLVTSAYATGSSAVYAKRGGRTHWAAFLMLAPVMIPQRLAHRWLARRGGVFTVAPGVSFGPIHAEAPEGAAILDLTAEHRLRKIPESGYVAIPLNDLAEISPEKLELAAETVERLREKGPVHIVCALGLSRSAGVAAAWLQHTGRARTEHDAVRAVREARPEAFPELR